MRSRAPVLPLTLSRCQAPTDHRGSGNGPETEVKAAKTNQGYGEMQMEKAGSSLLACWLWCLSSTIIKSSSRSASPQHLLAPGQLIAAIPTHFHGLHFKASSQTSPPLPESFPLLWELTTPWAILFRTFKLTLISLASLFAAPPVQNNSCTQEVTAELGPSVLSLWCNSEFQPKASKTFTPS